MLKTPYTLILGSQSPRRKQLLEGLDIEFQVRTIEIDETFPNDIPLNTVAEYLAREKGNAHLSSIKENELIITSDTVVLCDNQILGKPKNREHAQEMLRMLSGKTHQVITGVCLTSKDKTVSFSDVTKVVFKNLTDKQIDYYIDKYQPLDKAGGYGIQEWIGYTGISSIEGSYFNVMGLPVARLYDVLIADFT